MLQTSKFPRVYRTVVAESLLQSYLGTGGVGLDLGLCKSKVVHGGLLFFPHIDSSCNVGGRQIAASGLSWPCRFMLVSRSGLLRDANSTVLEKGDVDALN